ncbi:hypothetical protein COU61_05155 [Candidatus Pacearchaeota archaeon CG10_big_fil_rev_8_21_14_0_10_35_13]|nr:MAG: hypothetical protein COU61_05155 [Candidatus Pacearchaeota archaeon CG10_big_fil_rev_8_21_14_0_10_35_13]
MITKKGYETSRFHFTNYPVNENEGTLSVGCYELEDCDDEFDAWSKAFGILGGPIICGVRALKDYDIIRTKNPKGNTELLIKHDDGLIMRVYNPKMDRGLRETGHGVIMTKRRGLRLLEILLEEIAMNIFIEKNDSRDGNGKRY